MKKNLKIAKRLVAIAKALVGANEYTPSDNARDIVHQMQDDDIVNLLQNMILLFRKTIGTSGGSVYSSLRHEIAQKNKTFSKGIKVWQSENGLTKVPLPREIKQGLVVQFAEDPTLIRTNTGFVRGDTGVNDAKETAIKAINTALVTYLQQNQTIQKAGSFIKAIYERINRAYQYKDFKKDSQSGQKNIISDAELKEDQEFLTKVLDMLQSNDAFINSMYTQEDTSNELDFIKETTHTQLVNNVKDIKVRTKKLFDDAEIAEKAQDKLMHNRRIIIGLFDGVFDKKKSLDYQLFAVSSVANITADAINIKYRQELNKAYGTNLNEDYPTQVEYHDDPRKSSANTSKSLTADDKTVEDPLQTLENSLNILNASKCDGGVKTAGVLSGFTNWLSNITERIINGIKNVAATASNLVHDLADIWKAMNELDQDDIDIRAALHEFAETAMTIFNVK